MTRPAGLRSGQVLTLDGTEWTVGCFIPLDRGRRLVELQSNEGDETLYVPLPAVRSEPNLTGRCLADDEAS